MAKLTYKNISNQDQSVIGVGLVKAGETIEVDEPLENPNFEQVNKAGKKVGVDPVTKPEENK